MDHNELKRTLKNVDPEAVQRAMRENQLEAALANRGNVEKLLEAARQAEYALGRAKASDSYDDSVLSSARAQLREALQIFPK